jgi:hypothetical protein
MYKSFFISPDFWKRIGNDKQPFEQLSEIGVRNGSIYLFNEDTNLN